MPTRPPGMQRAQRRAREGPRDPPADLPNVINDLPPELQAAALGFLRSLRDRHLMQGATVTDLVNILHDVETSLERFDERPSQDR